MLERPFEWSWCSVHRRSPRINRALNHPQDFVALLCRHQRPQARGRIKGIADPICDGLGGGK